MRLVHVVAGLLALAAGAIALYAPKGSRLHRLSGRIFVTAILVMTSSAAVMATFLVPNPVNVVAAALTFYLASTALLTVRRQVAQIRALTAVFMLVALAVGAYALDLGFEALDDAKGIFSGEEPPAAVFLFAITGLMGAALDARLLWAGSIRGAHRLVRHLWRMTFAMWITTTSFFIGQADVFPEPVRESAFLATPVLIVTVLLFYWLGRVLILRERAVPRFRAVRQ